METETKVELLKYMLLNQSCDYDMMLYDLIRRKRLTGVISKIDERTFYFNIQAEDGKISAGQFLNILHELVRYMKLYFYNIAPLSSCIDYVVECNELELTNLLSYKSSQVRGFFYRLDDATFEELLNKLIISSFISNVKYVTSIKDVLDDIQVPLKNIEDYSLEESKKILVLMSDIAFCQRGRGSVMKLFEKMDCHLEEYNNMDLTRRKKSVDDFKKKYTDSCIADYDKLIKSYYSKKKYLKYFS